MLLHLCYTHIRNNKFQSELWHVVCISCVIHNIEN
jgi:hypothetical protein